jgi:hypothetical protein
MSKLVVKGIKGKPEMFHAVYDFAVDGGTAGAKDIFTLLAGTIVHDCFYEVETTVTSGGSATLELGLTGGDTDGFVAQAAKTDFAADAISGDAKKGALLTGGLRAKVTADTVCAMVIGTAALTAGKIHFYLLASDGY